MWDESCPGGPPGDTRLGGWKWSFLPSLAPCPHSLVNLCLSYSRTGWCCCAQSSHTHWSIPCFSAIFPALYLKLPNFKSLRFWVRHSILVFLTLRNLAHCWGPCTGGMGPPNKVLKTGQLDNRNVASLSSGGWNSEIKVSAGLVVLQTPRSLRDKLSWASFQVTDGFWQFSVSIGLQKHHPDLCIPFPMAFTQYVYFCNQIYPFFKEHQSYWIRIHLNDLILTVSAKILFENNVTFSGTGVSISTSFVVTHFIS